MASAASTTTGSRNSSRGNSNRSTLPDRAPGWPAWPASVRLVDSAVLRDEEDEDDDDEVRSDQMTWGLGPEEREEADVDDEGGDEESWALLLESRRSAAAGLRAGLPLHSQSLGLGEDWPGLAEGLAGVPLGARAALHSLQTPQARQARRPQDQSEALGPASPSSSSSASPSPFVPPRSSRQLMTKLERPGAAGGMDRALWEALDAVGFSAKTVHTLCKRRPTYCWRSRELGYAALMSINRHTQLPPPCAALILQFLLEPSLCLASWCNDVILSADRSMASAKRSFFLGRSGSLVYSTRPLVALRAGRYAEMVVSSLAGNLSCGLIMGITSVDPGKPENGQPMSILEVVECISGLPRCSAPRFRIGSRLGYLATWSGDLVLYIDGFEAGRHNCPSLANRCPLWLVVDLAHDVNGLRLEDSSPPVPWSISTLSLQFVHLSSLQRTGLAIFILIVVAALRTILVLLFL